MKIKIKVIPKAKDNLVIPIEGYFCVRVTAPATQGQANQKAIEVLSKYFKVPKSKITIVSGKTFREKIVNIEEDNGS